MSKSSRTVCSDWFSDYYTGVNTILYDKSGPELMGMLLNRSPAPGPGCDAVVLPDQEIFYSLGPGDVNASFCPIQASAPHPPALHRPPQ